MPKHFVALLLGLAGACLQAASPISEKLYLARSFDGKTFTFPIAAVEAESSHIRGIVVHQGETKVLPAPDAELVDGQWQNRRDEKSPVLYAVIAFDDDSFLVLTYPKTFSVSRIGELYAKTMSRRTVLSGGREVAYSHLSDVKFFFAFTKGTRYSADSLEGVNPPGGVLRATCSPLP